jgi:hypothetical protein
MSFSTIKISGADALAALEQYRLRYQKGGEYPFLIGHAEELERLKGNASFNSQSADEIICASLDIDIVDWLKQRRAEEEEYEFSPDELLGDWPGVIAEKGSSSLHADILTGKIKKEVFLGLAIVEKPWQLPAVLKYGDWNACPAPEVHCAFFRKWGMEFGAQITGMSSDVIECVVAHPPRDQESAIKLAWDQYWYCADIVDQGVGSIHQLAATLLNSPYWYFWWD